MPGLSRSTNLPWMVIRPAPLIWQPESTPALADDELGALAERDRAVLEEALDLHRRARVELEVRVAEDVALAEVALVRRGGRGRAPAREERLAIVGCR